MSVSVVYWWGKNTKDGCVQFVFMWLLIEDLKNLNFKYLQFIYIDVIMI